MYKFLTSIIQKYLQKHLKYQYIYHHSYKHHSHAIRWGAVTITTLLLFSVPIVPESLPLRYEANAAHIPYPALRFTDMASGPNTGLGDRTGKGAIVTMWGNDLGSTQGTSKIYFKDSAGTVHQAAHIYYWTNADGKTGGGPADLYSYQKMQEVAFSIPDSASPGKGAIYVEVNRKKSNSLYFTIRPGKIYHVKTNGNDTTGNGSWSKPWKTISTGAIPKVGAGDTIYAHDRIQEIDTDNRIANKSAGIRITSKKGTYNTPFSLIAYPGAHVLVQGENYGISNQDSAYWVISKLSVKAGEFEYNSDSHVSTGIETFKGGRLIGNEITDRENVVRPTSSITGCAEGRSGAISGNALNGDKVSGAKIYGNYIHDWGCDDTSEHEHAVYISNRSYSSKTDPHINVRAWELGWNFLKDNKAIYGLHNYDENVKGGTECGDLTGILKIHDNAVVNQRGSGINVINGGPTTVKTCWTVPTEVYNNLLVSTGLGPNGTRNVPEYNYKVPMYAMYFGGYGLKSPIKAYNNTIYGYGDSRLSTRENSGGALRVGNTSRDRNRYFNGTLEWINNIVYDTKNFSFSNIGPGLESKIIAHNNNLWYHGGNNVPSQPPTWDTAPKIGNPLLRDVKNNDFSPSAKSPVLDVGLNLSTISSAFKKDFYGISRPQNFRYDIGAFEFRM